ncbi:MAG: SAF domain-containing protein [Mycobacteriales bacterium]
MSDTPSSPPASRLSSPGWLDSRLVLGVLLVLVSVVVGARVLSSADRSTLVYAAARDLTAGSVLGEKDLTPVRVRLFENAAAYVGVADDRSPSGLVLRRAVGSGELLPLEALVVPGEDVDYRLVTVPVDVGHAPPGLAANAQVDVWVTPDRRSRDDAAAAGGGPAGPATVRPLELRGAQLVLQGVTVLEVRSDGAGFSGSTAVPFVLQVRPSEVSALVSAMSLGRIDLVRLPRAAESSGRLEPVAGSGAG